MLGCVGSPSIFSEGYELLFSLTVAVIGLSTDIECFPSLSRFVSLDWLLQRQSVGSIKHLHAPKGSNGIGYNLVT